MASHANIPKNYFQHKFPPHLEELMKKINVGTFPGIPGGGKHFHLSELRPDMLSHIPKDELPIFLSALACTTLYDQFMYSHFRRFYRGEFLAEYPKITSSYSNCTNINPWELLNINGASKTELEKTFREFVVFYVPYMKEKIENDFPFMSWFDFARIAQKDNDVLQTNYGKYFVNEIRMVTV